MPRAWTRVSLVDGGCCAPGTIQQCSAMCEMDRPPAIRLRVFHNPAFNPRSQPHQAPFAKATAPQRSTMKDVVSAWHRCQTMARDQSYTPTRKSILVRRQIGIVDSVIWARAGSGLVVAGVDVRRGQGAAEMILGMRRRGSELHSANGVGSDANETCARSSPGYIQESFRLEGDG